MGSSLAPCCVSRGRHDRGSWLDDWFGSQAADLEVSGFDLNSGEGRLPVARANGSYTLCGELHGCPVYQHNKECIFVYYWDDKDGEIWRGWWLGPSVGSSFVWAYNPGPCGALPPESDWRSPWDGPSNVGVCFKTWTCDKAPRAIDKLPELQHGIPQWLSGVRCSASPIEFNESPGSLQTCSICLEPLWNARPSVFLVNLKRLCPHYFCYECAQRVMTERTRIVQTLRERVQLGLSERLPVVFDVYGQQIGDLVWRANGLRVTEGEFALMLEQLRRLEEPKEGMEVQFQENGAVVFYEGELYGRLLRSTSRALRRISQDEFDADGLGSVVEGDTVASFRERYTVLQENACSTWDCARCTLENSCSEFRCLLCGAAPPRPKKLNEHPKPLKAADVAALTSRFAVRPIINWAVPLQCPLCRAEGCASLSSLPDLQKAPNEWFRLADLEGRGKISPSELVRALSAVLPISPERLRALLEAHVPIDPEGILLADFLREGGPAHWAVQHIMTLEQ